MGLNLLKLIVLSSELNHSISFMAATATAAAIDNRAGVAAVPTTDTAAATSAAATQLQSTASLGRKFWTWVLFLLWIVMLLFINTGVR